ncbi:hypothetical protein CMUS01_07306 [Colletotrichum musicola]|uniref:IDI-2 n=1 Tax=Colletotrichum musicola TaxID=2175873 RepID=A0A8H6KIA6_9PEZI|nr:hypothetical protein CMUS01_07306 [Colletotrichum musicola]
MKFTTILVSLLAAHVQAGVVSLEAECGDLQVMSHDSLPANVDPSQVRKCKEHPLRLSPNVKGHQLSGTAEDGSALERRDCWYGNPFGCSDGYCWKTCLGDGRWCWTAWDNGFGNWQTCAADGECDPKEHPNANCGEGDGCDSCGCSC